MRISKKAIDSINSMDKFPISRFKGSEINLFRSHDPQLTSIYHAISELKIRIEKLSH